MTSVKNSQTDEAINTNADLPDKIAILKHCLRSFNDSLLMKQKRIWPENKHKYYYLLASVFICQGTSEGQLGVL